MAGWCMEILWTGLHSFRVRDPKLTGHSSLWMFPIYGCAAFLEPLMRRLISILVDNAVKYGAEGGTITLALEKTDRQARLTVSNPGDPIPPEHLAHLFERFYRADASRGEKSGFGLGLAIADTIAWEHKGALKAESDAASTRFTFTIPLRKQA